MSAAIKNREFALAFLEGKKVLYKPSHHKEFDPADDVRNIGAFDEHGFDFCIAPNTISVNTSPSPSDIRRARVALDMTQSQAANLVHVTLNAWQRWEMEGPSGRKMPPGLWELFNIKTGRYKNGSEDV